MTSTGIILGIETSCDETAVAILKDGALLLSNLIASQIDIHRPYGGVVPEIASRQHLQTLPILLQQALKEAGVRLEDLSAIAATRGPGLIPSVLIGLSAGKGLAFSLNKPFIGVNHLRAHVYAGDLIASPPSPPMIVTLVSGGHTQILYVDAEDKIICIGKTHDDAAGEAFDKGARIMGLEYPGGPSIEKKGFHGNPDKYRFPKAFMEPGNYDFSYSGLKTALLYFLRKRPDARIENVAASFQEAIIEPIIHKSYAAARSYGTKTLLFAGGVAANAYLRKQAELRAEKRGLNIHFPPPALCTDNAAMVAMAGWKRFIHGDVDGLDCPASSSLPIEVQ